MSSDNTRALCSRSISVNRKISVIAEKSQNSQGRNTRFWESRVSNAPSAARTLLSARPLSNVSSRHRALPQTRYYNARREAIPARQREIGSALDGGKKLSRNSCGQAETTCDRQTTRTSSDPVIDRRALVCPDRDLVALSHRRGIPQPGRIGALPDRRFQLSDESVDAAFYEEVFPGETAISLRMRFTPFASFELKSFRSALGGTVKETRRL